MKLHVLPEGAVTWRALIMCATISFVTTIFGLALITVIVPEIPVNDAAVLIFLSLAVVYFVSDFQLLDPQQEFRYETPATVVFDPRPPIVEPKNETIARADHRVRELSTDEPNEHPQATEDLEWAFALAKTNFGSRAIERWDRHILKYQSTSGLETHVGTARFNKAAQLAKLGFIDKACEAYSEVIHSHGSQLSTHRLVALAFLNRASLLIRCERQEEAIQDLTNLVDYCQVARTSTPIIDLNMYLIGGLVELGGCYLDINDLESAFRAFARAVMEAFEARSALLDPDDRVLLEKAINCGLENPKIETLAIYNRLWLIVADSTLRSLLGQMFYLTKLRHSRLSMADNDRAFGH
jgi:hypothetical protein